MTRLQQLHDLYGQSPWLDNLTRGDVTGGRLEDAAIPSRVIDELMGHAGGRRDRGTGGSPMGRVYRETTPAMMARVTAALDERIGHALAVAASLLHERQDSRVVDGGESR